MSLIVSSTSAYVSIAEVRSFGVPESADDESIQDAIEVASDVINSYTGKIFDPTGPIELVVNDVRKPLLPLPTPFADVTAVRIDGVPLTSDQWVVEDWGLRLLQTVGNFDADGFPRSDVGDFGLPALGVQVVIRASFGYASVPARVRLATKLLAARFATQGIADLVPEAALKRLSVEGYTVEYDHTSTPLETTGDASVDRLLRGHRSMYGWVA